MNETPISFAQIEQQALVLQQKEMALRVNWNMMKVPDHPKYIEQSEDSC